jgi:hypothetical protein
MSKRESSTIEHPVFGTLKLDESGDWTRLVHLPVFARYDEKSDGYVDIDGEDQGQSRRAKREKRRAEQFAAGLFPLHIVDMEESGPSTAQEEAYRFLIEHESQVADAIMSYVFRTYAHRDDYWTLDGLQQGEFGVKLSEPSDLKRVMRLSSVMIVPADGDVADVIFYFNSSLDEEHGVEVTTNRAEIEDDVFDLFPIDLPDELDATEIAPEPAGHRFVELRHHGRWHGIYVLDDGLRCVGRVATSVTARSYRHRINSPDQIEGIRAPTRWHRWFASPARRHTARWLATSNWLVSLPCLLVAWAFLPQLFWVSLSLSVLCFVGNWVLDEEWRLLPIVQVVVSIAGLVYASDAPDFGNPEHVKDVLGVYGSIVWWCVATIDALAIAVFLFLVVGFNRNTIREGLGAVLPVSLPVVALTSGLAASHYGYWSIFHLLWLTPLAIVASFAVLGVGIFTDVLDFSKRCPECGEPLRTARAQQCLECGADWH